MGTGQRILMTLYLIAHKRLSLPALFLSDYILNNRTEYYKKLRAVTYKNQWGEWVKFILTAVLEQANKTTKAIERINIAKLKFEQRIPSEIPKQRRTDLLTFLFTTVAFSKSQMALNLDVHPNTASAYIKSMLAKNLLNERRHKNSKVFYVPSFVEILAQ